jgi:hypothetical protein
VCAVSFSDLVDRDDVRVIECRVESGFAKEAPYPFLIHGEALGKDFESDFAAEFCILGKINIAHTARGDDSYDLVMSDLLPDVSVMVDERFGDSFDRGLFEITAIIRIEQTFDLAANGIIRTIFI